MSVDWQGFGDPVLQFLGKGKTCIKMCHLVPFELMADLWAFSETQGWLGEPASSCQIFVTQSLGYPKNGQNNVCFLFACYCLLFCFRSGAWVRLVSFSNVATWLTSVWLTNKEQEGDSGLSRSVHVSLSKLYSVFKIAHQQWHKIAPT